MVEWSTTYLCSKCNATRQVVKVLEEGIDPDTKNLFRRIEMDCGHTEKTVRISNELTLRWQINKGEQVRVDPIITGGTPSVAVSGGSQSTVLPGSVNIGLEGAKNNTIFVNITAVKSEGNSNVVQNLSSADVKITYSQILKEIDRDISSESERREIKDLLEEIKNDLDSKRIPDSGLIQKLKRYEKIYTAVSPWIMKGIDLIKFFNQ